MDLLFAAAGAPESGLFHAYLLENPWPVGLMLLIAGVAVGALSLREGRTARLPIAAVVIALGVGVMLAGMLVTTAGEHAERVTRDLVVAVEGNDLTGADRLLADDMTYGATSLSNLPVGGKDDIMKALSEFTARVTLEKNRVTSMEIATVDGQTGHARLSLWTEGSGGNGQVPLIGRSSWILVVERGEDGTWRVQRIIWVDLNGQTPPVNRM